MTALAIRAVAALTILLLAGAGEAVAQSRNSLVVGPAVLVRQKAWAGAGADVIAVPWIEARFGRFALRGLQASYELGGAGSLRLSAIGNARLGGVEPDDLEPRLELFEREPTLELGLSATLPVGSFRISAEASADALGRHGGWDGGLRVARPLRAGRLMLIPAAGVRYWSSDLASFEYGLEPGEAGFADGWIVESTFIPELSVAGSFALGPKWSVVGFARAARLGSAITDSPIVERSSETIAGIALARRIR
ncbi:MAG TPA: MipA/OmpV family protein [Thermoanaerobaculia bacterium]